MDNKGDRNDQASPASVNTQGPTQLYPAQQNNSVLFPVGLDNEKEIGTPDDRITTLTHASATIQVHHNPHTQPSQLNQNRRPSLLEPVPNPRTARVSFANDDREARVNVTSDSTLRRRTRASSYGSSFSRSTSSGASTPRPRTFSAVSIKDGYRPGKPFSGWHVIPELTKESAELFSRTNESAETRRKGLGRKVWKFLSLLWIYISIQVLNLFLLFLPRFYYSRITSIFEEVQCSGESLKNAIKENLRGKQPEDEDYTPVLSASDSTHMLMETLSMTTGCPPEVRMLEQKWQHFIDVLLKEWKIMNIVSVLLLSAIASSMQIGPVFADEVIRNLAIAALICALMSLVYSCTYSIRFSIMRPVHKAVEWAKEGEARRTTAFWNVWIFLSIPAIWLSWSLILFVSEILTIVWRVDGPDHALVLDHRLRLTIRIGITLILGAGLVYFGLILFTLKRYGSQMDDAWIESVTCLPFSPQRDNPAAFASIDDQLTSSFSRRGEESIPSTNLQPSFNPVSSTGYEVITPEMTPLPAPTLVSESGLVTSPTGFHLPPGSDMLMRRDVPFERVDQAGGITWLERDLQAKGIASSEVAADQPPSEPKELVNTSHKTSKWSGGVTESSTATDSKHTLGKARTPIFLYSFASTLPSEPRVFYMHGVSPLLGRQLSARFLFDPTSEIENTFSHEKLASSASYIPTSTITMWHRRIPYTLCILKEPSITIGDLLRQLGVFLQMPVPEGYLTADSRQLDMAASERDRAGGSRGIYRDVIRTADWVWSTDFTILGFTEHVNGTWELETSEKGGYWLGVPKS